MTITQIIVNKLPLYLKSSSLLQTLLDLDGYNKKIEILI